jgi:hypothetical protein
VPVKQLSREGDHAGGSILEVVWRGGAAGYGDRILKGAKSADLPVQAPTKYELAINLNCEGARARNSVVGTGRADEVIE